MSDEKKIQWTLGAIQKLLDAGIGEAPRLHAIKNTLENGRTVYDSDKNYLKSKFEELKQSEKGKQEESHVESEITKNLTLIKKLQNAELGNPEKLNSIKSALENKQPLSIEDSKYLVEKYYQLQKVDDLEGKITKALNIIQKLKEEEIGDSKRLDSIKKILDERGSLSSDDDAYLAEKFKQYRKIKNQNIRESVPESRPSAPRSYNPEYKSEGTTLVLSIVLGLFGLCGVGHMYVGKVGKGVGILILGIVLFAVGIATIAFGVGIIFLIIFVVLFIWQIVDSRKLCFYYNGYLDSNGDRPW